MPKNRRYWSFRRYGDENKKKVQKRNTRRRSRWRNNLKKNQFYKKFNICFEWNKSPTCVELNIPPTQINQNQKSRFEIIWNKILKRQRNSAILPQMAIWALEVLPLEIINLRKFFLRYWQIKYSISLNY